MSKSIILYIAGIFLILAAVMYFMFMIAGAANDVHYVTVKPHGTSTTKLHIDAGHYVISMKAHEVPLNYTVHIESENKTIHGVLNDSKTLWLNFTKGDELVLNFTNPTNTTVQVNVVIMKNKELADIANKELASLFVCLAGVIVVIIGIVSSIRIRK